MRLEINQYEEIIRHALDFISDDYTELWVISNKIHKENPNYTLADLKFATIAVIRDLVEKHKVKMVDDRTYQTMDISLEEILQRVGRKFTDLNRKPDIGDGLWFLSGELSNK